MAPMQNGIVTLYDALFQETFAWKPFYRQHFSNLQLGQQQLSDFKFELFPVHSQLLGES
jgi:hypothetical protein